MAAWVYQDLLGWKIYHFHDTSDGARVKQRGDIEDNRLLQPDAGNLAAFLYWMQQKKHEHFNRIEHTIRQVAPFFGGFRLGPSQQRPDQIRLEWKEQGQEGTLGPNALSDGTLRFMCLVALLLQPDLPQVILLDEPELGLHPAAITLLAEMLSAAAERTQVIVATQSVPLVNQLAAEDLVVVERREGLSVFNRLVSKDLEPWLNDYALGELWEKNILGGRP
jgi:predicted ATPase